AAVNRPRRGRSDEQCSSFPTRTRPNRLRPLPTVGRQRRAPQHPPHPGAQDGVAPCQDVATIPAALAWGTVRPCPSPAGVCGCAGRAGQAEGEVLNTGRGFEAAVSPGLLPGGGDQDFGGIMAVWLVRAGKYSEREQTALEKSVLVIGWNELPDLTSTQ